MLMQKYEERVGRLEDAFVTLTELARNVDQRVDSHDELMNSLDEHLITQIESLHEYLQSPERRLLCSSRRKQGGLRRSARRLKGRV